jgi:hypothetical protein
MILRMENGAPIIGKSSHSSDRACASFSVIAVHDGYQAEMQVNQAFAWLHQCFRADLRMSFKAWTFEKLVSALDIRAMSVRIGVEADLIIIAASSGMPLPDHIKRWLDSIIWQRRGDRALVLALEEDDHSPCAQTSILCQDLQQWAARWHTELICCADIHHPPSRQSILRRINERFHHVPAASHDQSDMKLGENMPLTIHQTMNQNQTTMTAAQIQEVRGLAYHLWLQANRPAGKEIDFWLSAEQKDIQATAGKAAHEPNLNAAPAAKSAAKKLKPNAKHTK